MARQTSPHISSSHHRTGPSTSRWASWWGHRRTNSHPLSSPPPDFCSYKYSRQIGVSWALSYPWQASLASSRDTYRPPHLLCPAFAWGGHPYSNYCVYQRTMLSSLVSSLYRAQLTHDPKFIYFKCPSKTQVEYSRCGLADISNKNVDEVIRYR